MSMTRPFQPDPVAWTPGIKGFVKPDTLYTLRNGQPEEVAP